MTDVAITAIKDQIEALTKEGKEIIIHDNASYVEAGEFLKKIKQAQKTVDDTRKGMTRPLDESKKKIMDLFRPVEARIADLESSLKGSILTYQRIQDEKLKKELEERRKKEEAELAERQKDAEFFGDDGVEFEPSKVEDMPKSITPTVAGIATKTVWDFEITDPEKLPRTMLSPDLKKIRAAIDFGIREQEGLRIFQKNIISARS